MPIPLARYTLQQAQCQDMAAYIDDTLAMNSASTTFRKLPIQDTPPIVYPKLFFGRRWVKERSTKSENPLKRDGKSHHVPTSTRTPHPSTESTETYKSGNPRTRVFHKTRSKVQKLSLRREGSVILHVHSSRFLPARTHPKCVSAMQPN